MKTLMTIPGPGRRKKRPGALRRLLTALVAATLLYVAFFALDALRRDYPLAVPIAPESATDLRGAFHVHSTRSDGRGTIEEIAAAAREAGLQFVILADHNIEPSPPRFVEGVLIIDAVELSTPNGHLVALNLSRALTEEERNGDVLGTISQLGGHSLLAHPEQQKNPWRDWPSAPRAVGLELYSADTMFRTAQAKPFTSLGPAAAAWLTNPTHGLLSIVTEQPELRARALQLSGSAPYVTVCSHDAHGLPSYESVFRTLSLYVRSPSGGRALPEDAEALARHVLGELTSGRSFCAFHALADGDGFALEGITPERVARAGQSLKVHLPSRTPGEVQIRVHGAARLDADGRTVHPEGAGAVQLEVWAKVRGMYFQDGWKPWLVGSPFRVISAEAALPDTAAPAITDAGVDGGAG